jgi:hypothetical protein
MRRIDGYGLEEWVSGSDPERSKWRLASVTHRREASGQISRQNIAIQRRFATELQCLQAPDRRPPQTSGLLVRGDARGTGWSRHGKV